MDTICSKLMDTIYSKLMGTIYSKLKTCSAQVDDVLIIQGMLEQILSYHVRIGG